MQINSFHPYYGEIIYTEGFWSGKKNIIITGHNVQRINKNEFLIDGRNAFLKGNYIGGVKLFFDNEIIILSPAPKFYEIIFALLPLIFLLIWGNVPSLCKMLPLVGGALGGALGGLSFVVSVIFSKQQNTFLKKLLVALSVFLITIFIAYVLAICLIEFFY